MPLRNGAGIALAAVGTLAFGAVLGPEAPLVALGSVVGVAMATLGRAGEQETRILALAGSFSAVSALFGGPIVGGLLMIESGLDRGAALLPALIPGFVAAALGYVLFIGLGDWGGLNAQAIAVPGLPTYTGTHVLDLLVGIGVGVASAITVVAIRAAAAENARLGPLRLGMPRLLLAGGLAVGVLAEIANLARRQPQRRPVLRPGGDPRPDRPGLGRDRPAAARHQGHRLRDQPELRLPRRPRVPRDLPRHRIRDAVRRLVRRVADVGSVRRRGGRHGRRHATVADADRVRRAARRACGRGYRAGCRARVGGGVADGGGGGSASGRRCRCWRCVTALFGSVGAGLLESFCRAAEFCDGVSVTFPAYRQKT